MARLKILKCFKCGKLTIFFDLFDIHLKIESNSFPQCVNHLQEKVLFDYEKNKLTSQGSKLSTKYGSQRLKGNTNGTTFFCADIGDYINTKDIDRVAKERGYVYLSDKEIESEAKKNKAYMADKIQREFKQGLADELRRVI